MKLSKHAWTIWGILLVVALVLMVLIPFSRTASWWIAAGCTVLMFLLAAWTFYAAFRKDGLESKILGWPIFKVGAVALAVQVVLGFALMGLAALCPAWVTALAEVLIFAVTGILPEGAMPRAWWYRRAKRTWRTAPPRGRSSGRRRTRWPHRGMRT